MPEQPGVADLGPKVTDRTLSSLSHVGSDEGLLDRSNSREPSDHAELSRERGADPRPLNMFARTSDSEGGIRRRLDSGKGPPPLSPRHPAYDSERAHAWASERSVAGMALEAVTGDSADALAHEEELWTRYENELHPDMFHHLELASDGGFSEVHRLMDKSRYFTAFALVAFVMYNFLSVALLDLQFMTDPDAAVEAMGGNQRSIVEPWYLTRDLIDAVGARLTGDEDYRVNPVVALGALELCGFLFYVVKVLWCFWVMAFPGDTGFRRWYHMQHLCWDLLPALSTFSAMKLLNIVVPSVFLVRVHHHVAAITEAWDTGRSKTRAACGMVLFLLGIVFCFFAGVDSFLMKMRVVAGVVEERHVSARGAVHCLQFFVQVLGIVQLGTEMRARLFVFIFGGEDGVMQSAEIELLHTWNALLARQMYRDLPFHHFLATILSFSDEDLQSLVLNEDHEKKESHLKSTYGTPASVVEEQKARKTLSDSPDSKGSPSKANLGNTP